LHIIKSSKGKGSNYDNEYVRGHGKQKIRI